MLRTIAVVLFVTGMAAGMAQAKGTKAATCQTEQQATTICACGPAKKLCKKGQWCHAFTNTCTQ
jgi:hypothetical protein